MTHSRSALALSAVLLATAFGASADLPNPLIGKWHLTGETLNSNMPGVHCPITDMTLTPTTALTVDGGGSPPARVSYVVATPTKATILYDAGYVVYDVLDHNHIRREEVLQCTYTRVR